jgi:signal transduction histidine kinase
MTDGESQAEKVARELREQFNELAELAGSLAHEIKNPLSVIQMNMDLLAEDFADSETPEERRALAKIEMVQKQCTRLDTMLRDFLRFARLRDLELYPGSLNEIVGRVLDFFQRQADEAGIQFIRFLDPALPSIKLDEQTLYAALLNLVKNSIEAMPDGGQLVARTRITRQGVALDLIDTGHGMDNETALKMFDAFYSTKGDGSGLGLPTARKIFEAHGGRINVQSEVGHGTQFTIEFPQPARIQ